MPRDGVRALLTGGRVDAAAVASLSSHFGVGAQAATWHLHNLGFISEEARYQLVADSRVMAP